MLTYYKQKNSTPQANRGKVHTSMYSSYNDSGAEPNNYQAYVGCSSHQPSVLETSYCLQRCLAWGQTFSNCGKPDCLSRVCQLKKHCQAVIKSLETNEASMDILTGDTPYWVTIPVGTTGAN